MKGNVRFDDTTYRFDELDRTTRALRNNSTAVIKYIAPRVIAPSTPHPLQDTLRRVARANVNSNPSATTTTPGLVLGSIASNVKYTSISAIHIIDGERIIDEHRDLSRLTEILTNAILQCCYLESYNRVLESQIEWLENHDRENGFTIETMYRTEISNAQALANQNTEQKSRLERQISEIETTTSAQDQKYHQLLTNRDEMSKILFDLERQIALNAAEIQFLQRRTKHLDDESQYYLLRNRSLDDRKLRLRYELDEELVSQQTLSAELKILQSEKISTDDVHLVALDEFHNSIDISQVAGRQPSRDFLDHLNAEFQRIRQEYENKTETYREEIQRKLELELYRYRIHASRSAATTLSSEQEVQMETYQQEMREVNKKIAVVRERFSEIRLQIENAEKKLIAERDSRESEYKSKQELTLLNQLIEDREQQLQEALRIRNDYKQQIEGYKKQMARHSGNKLIRDSYIRSSFHESTQSLSENQILRSSYQELTNQNNPEYQPPTRARLSPSPLPPTQRLSTLQVEDSLEGGTLIEYSGFNVDQDCQNLQHLLSYSSIDEVSLIRILCNRSVGQRLQIRERYQTLLHQNLGDALEKLHDGNLSKLLRMLLLSPAERDCFELRRLSIGSQLDEAVLVEILFSRSKRHIQLVRNTYQKLFKTALEADILGNRDAQSKRIFQALLQADRPEGVNVNDTEILRDARDLYETAAQWSKDGSTFVRLLCTRSNTQLREIFAAYEQFGQMDIEKAIRIYTEGNLYYVLMAIVRIIRNRPRYFAFELKKYLRGVNTNEDNLNRIMVSRCEVDMLQIKAEYEKITQRTLYNHIQTDINNNYKRALLEIIRQRDESNPRSSLTEQSTVQWRETFSRVPSDTSIRRSVDHSFSERRVVETRDSADDQTKVITYTGPYVNSSQIKKRSLLILNTKPFRPRNVDENLFTPMPTTAEHLYSFPADEE